MVLQSEFWTHAPCIIKVTISGESGVRFFKEEWIYHAIACLKLYGIEEREVRHVVVICNYL